ncbi:hypothetical protein M9435_006134 [Picochlorum sp. BPE23]|nr:hypothetical protein M9435_006134 [Picochlorum sp. BPE23]
MERIAQHVQCSMASVSGRPEKCVVGCGSVRSTHWWRFVGQRRRMKNGLQVCRMSLDDMAEREMAKRKSSSSSKYSSASQKEFEDLVKAIPDPAEEQDGLLADDPMLEGWETDPMQSWDGLDGSASLLDAGALSSLPFGDVEAEEAAAAASEGVPTYRGKERGADQNLRGMPSMLPTSRTFRKPGTQTPQEAALEDFLMDRAVDEGMELHHARLEAAHNRYSVASAFGNVLQEIEQEDVWRNAEPLLPGTDLRIPTWIRASEAIMPLMDRLNEETIEYEKELTEAGLQEMEEQILEEVEAARKLLSLTDPKAGLSVESDIADMDALDEFFGDSETLLPGAANMLEGEEREIQMLAEGKENSIVNSLLEEILPEIGGYALDYADLTGDASGSNPSMLSGALQSLTEEVDTVLEEEDDGDEKVESSDDAVDTDEEDFEEDE